MPAQHVFAFNREIETLIPRDKEASAMQVCKWILYIEFGVSAFGIF
jgi:hypothetical protein